MEAPSLETVFIGQQFNFFKEDKQTRGVAGSQLNFIGGSKGGLGMEGMFWFLKKKEEDGQ